MKVLTTPEVFDYLNELVTILHEKGYFGIEYLAIDYVDKLLYDITTNLPSKQHKPAPAYFDKYGKNMEYASFRKNRNTAWYAFFTTYWENDEEIYLVRYIANNHVIAKYL